jgi:hypothetical protein
VKCVQTVTGASECLHKLQKALVERECWKDLGEDAGVVVRRALRKYDGLAWSRHPAEDTEKWRTVVNIMNLEVQ